MNNKTATAIITKVFFLSLLILSAAVTASAQESMIPDDFDWSVFLQGVDSEWNSWGSDPQQDPYNYGYQEPITYEWAGQTNTSCRRMPLSAQGRWTRPKRSSRSSGSGTDQA